jgi:hypothetical protein
VSSLNYFLHSKQEVISLTRPPPIYSIVVTGGIEKVARGQKSISVTAAEFKVLGQAKKNFERLTGASPSWGAYLVALSAGALATYAIKGFELRCPSCEATMEMKLVKPKIESSEDSGELSPSFSREPTGRYKQ